MPLAPIKRLRHNAPLAFSVALAYCLFALTPFLFLHSHGAEHGAVVHAHVSATHHTAPPHHIHGHDHGHAHGLSHFVVHATQHAQESDGDHFGVDSPPLGLISTISSLTAFPLLGPLQNTFVPLASPPPDLERLPTETVSRTPCYFADGFPPFLTSALPPPSHS